MKPKVLRVQANNGAETMMVLIAYLIRESRNGKMLVKKKSLRAFLQNRGVGAVTTGYYLNLLKQLCFVYEIRGALYYSLVMYPGLKDNRVYKALPPPVLDISEN